MVEFRLSCWPLADGQRYSIWECPRHQQPPAWVLVIHSQQGLLVGVHQMREQLAGGVSRRQFTSHLMKHRGGWLATPAQLLALKQHAGYEQHCSQASLALLASVYRALKGLGCLHSTTIASFKEVLGRQGHRLLLHPEAAAAQAAAAVPVVLAVPAVPGAAGEGPAAAAEEGPAENVPRVSAPPPRARAAAAAAPHPCPGSSHPSPSLASPPLDAVGAHTCGAAPPQPHS